jgi:glycosyltransferase involved in cell wall biosynthesis
MKLSVLSTVYNRPRHAAFLLRALALSARRPDEVILADDGSDPPALRAMEEAAAAAPFPVKIVRQTHEGARRSASRNLAIRAATGDYLLFFDCDMAPLPDTLSVHEALARPRRVLEGNRFFLDKETTEGLFALDALSADDLEKAFARGDGAEALAAEAAHAKAMKWRRWHLARPHKPKLLGCHFSLFKEDAARVNGFDENFKGWGYEDDDFARRLYRAGVEPASVILRARAVHLFHPSDAPKIGTRHRDRPNRAYFRRWFVPVRCKNGLAK